MGTRHISQAHQKLSDNFTASEAELLLEQLAPSGLIHWVMGIDPCREAAMTLAEQLDATGILNHRVDFQPVADDPCVGQQAATLRLAISGDAVHVVIVEGYGESRALLQDRQP